MRFLLMAALAVTIFGVPMKGSFWVLLLASGLFVGFATGFGLFVSTLVRGQIAAIFATMIATMIPTIQYAGLINPVASLEGIGAAIGRVYPATHMIIVSRGVFNKGLRLHDLHDALWAIGLSVPVILIAAVAMLRKQER